MPAELPNRTTSGSRSGDAFNKLRENARSHQPISAPGVLTSHTVHGVSFEADVSSRSYADDPAPFPFEIYHSDTWLKFKVKEGIVITTGEAITPTGIDTEITVASGTEKHWIYLDITADAASVENNATLPTWAVDKIPIGWIDASNVGDEVSVIHQFVHDNIFSPCIA